MEEGLQTDGTVERELRASALMTLGSLMEWQGDHYLARAPLHEALALFGEAGARRGQIFALNMLGNVAASQSAYTEAISWYEQTATLSREAGHSRGTATALHNVGMLALDQSDITAAASLLGRLARGRHADGPCRAPVRTLRMKLNTSGLRQPGR